ncbi:SRPBCC family protein [Amycolatopsis jejuensis]|uniref:SRPBCC family protein n=1 Tax=Amycolatopsis jejuensis TaxID=330084 RepID=UPI000524392A|nr:SRPBCC family protein [Amycolatopsis jejuensis]
MKLENTFTIAVPLSDVWSAMNDPETVAPCFPGADLSEYTGDSFSGTIKVKLGPISLSYRGTGTYLVRDEANHRIVIDATGRDQRGNGTAAAKVTGTLREAGEGKTEVRMLADLTITGRPAQFGGGLIAEVADKIIGQFASRLADRLSTGSPSPASAVETVREADDSVNAFAVLAVPLAKRLLPVVGAALVVVLVSVFVKRRSAAER